MNALIATDKSRLVRAGATAEEYLLFENNSDERHEFHNGDIIAMPGGTSEHSECIAALTALLYFQTKERGNKLFTSDMRIHIPTYNRYVYPDLSLVRGAPEFTDDRRTQLRNPTVIIEVLSDSTAEYDLSEKFEYYRSLPSLEEIAFFAQDRPAAQLFRKNTRGRWELIEVENGALEFASVQASVRLSDVYPQLSASGE